jgi:hypothetical protein
VSLGILQQSVAFRAFVEGDRPAHPLVRILARYVQTIEPGKVPQEVQLCLVPYQIGLAAREPFEFFADVVGLPEAIDGVVQETTLMSNRLANIEGNKLLGGREKKGWSSTAIGLIGGGNWSYTESLMK